MYEVWKVQGMNLASYRHHIGLQVWLLAVCLVYLVYLVHSGVAGVAGVPGVPGVHCPLIRSGVPGTRSMLPEKYC